MRFVLEVVRGREPPRSIELDAPTLDQARQSAAREGYSVISQRARRTFFHPESLRTAATPKTNNTVLVEQLRDLLNAGLSVIESLQTLGESTQGPQKLVIDRLVENLRAGQRLSQALESVGGFAPLLLALVATAEITSSLPQTLTRYLEHEQRAAEFRHRLISVSMYPALLLVVGLAVLLFLLLYVIPRFARVFEGMAAELPASADLMVAWSRWLAGHTTAVGFLGAGLLAVGVAVMVSPAARAVGLGWMLRWAPVRDRLRAYFLARWYRTAGMLNAGGIALPQACSGSPVPCRQPA